MVWRKTPDRRGWMQRQQESRRHVREAVAAWVALAGATTLDQEWDIICENRSGVPVVAHIRVTTEPLEESLGQD